MILSVDQFLSSAYNWMNENIVNIEAAWPLKGGWEGFAQVGIPLYILRQDSTIHILREQMVYKGTTQKADLLINSDQPDKSKIIVVELKCQSFENYKNFVSELEKDAQKLNGAFMDPYVGCRKILLGFTFTGDLSVRFKVPEKGSYQLTGFTILNNSINSVAMCYIAF